MSSLLFRKYGNEHTDRPDLGHFVDNLGVDLDLVINPRTVAVSNLLGHSRRRRGHGCRIAWRNGGNR